MARNSSGKGWLLRALPIGIDERNFMAHWSDTYGEQAIDISLLALVAASNLLELFDLICMLSRPL